MKTIKVLVVPADLSKPIEVREVLPHLDAMKPLVDGWLEVVALAAPPASCYLDEEGKLRHKPLNQRATALVQRHNARFADFIAGDAFVCGPPRAGVDTDCPDEYLKLVES